MDIHRVLVLETREHGNKEQDGPPVQAKAVLGGIAKLPCDINPPLSNDSSILVVWYKVPERSSDIIPIYSYDMRSKHTDKATHWKDEEYFKERAHFVTNIDPATLNIKRIEQRDEGEYICRVDFIGSPTRNSKIHLTIIIPPHKPNIVDEHGNTVTTVAGVYKEGSNMRLTCLVSGGRPAPTVRWWRGEMLMESRDEPDTDFPAVMRNVLIVTELTRSDLHAVFTCQASNNNISQPVSASVAIEMHLRPLSVSILSSEHAPLSADRKYEINCMTVGSRPPANLSWYMEGKLLTNYTQKVSEDGNMTTSTLTFEPTREDHDKIITCRAENPNIKDGVEEGTWKLNVFYKPICISEQKRIYGVARHEEARVVCQVEAYPPPNNFRWAFNNTEEMVDVSQDHYKNSTRHTQSVLTYKPVTEMDYGTVLCWASNTAGQQMSACIFHIIPAGKPEAPYNCTLMNQTTESLSVECTAGFDGGQPQNFLLEVYDQHSGVLQANVTSRDSAAFTVQDLEPGRVLTMKLYAFNSKGRSEATKLEGFTLKVAEKQTVRVLFTGTPVPFEITPLLGVLIGVVAVLLLITIVILGALKVRSDRRAHRPGDLPLKKATAPSSEDLYDADDRNPDVVPTNKDSDYQLTGSTAGTPLAAQATPDEVSTTSLPAQQTNHLQGLTTYSHNDYTNYPTLPLTGEVTYAELCLARPTTLSTATDPKLSCLSGGGLNNIGGFGSGGGGVLVGGKPYVKEATVYACIDHNARPPKIDQICQPTKGSTTGLLQDNNCITTNKQHHPREVVTVRTPLISTQESCV
ncbi:hypothetical protein PV327_000726 [Microctonus hyperodae]|uniref:Nephrin/kirre n=1 Tax=Microctonus hyperodae TaxID=165561 RepID=A0AA39L2N7_MICHY|nr:hypothetical protein PV327_000726 [Microctonus hyperodae]